MSVLDQLASAQDRSDEEPNQELATRLVAQAQSGSVHQELDTLAAALTGSAKAIRHDAIKVFYEIGYQQPALIEPYIEEFVALLQGRDNRLVWGAMTALGALAPRQPQALGPHIDTILKATQEGSVITQDWGVRVLAALAAARQDYAKRVWPYLMGFLAGCKPKDVARHAESLAAVELSAGQKQDLSEVLAKRMADLKPAAAKRVSKVLEGLE